jgi:cytochrome b561
MARSSIRLNPEQRYGRGAVLFHWSMFLLVLGVATLGLLHDSWPKATQAFWINIHAVLGLLVWVLLVARFAWRMRHTPPALPAEIGTFSRRASAIVHFALYGLLFVIPIIGVVTFVWHGRVFDFGLFQVNFGVQKNKAIFNPTEELHGDLAYVLFGLVGIHALAALWHHFIRHDGMLRRMWRAAGATDRPGAR